MSSCRATNAKLYVSAWSEHTASVIERGRCRLSIIALDRLLSRGKDGR